jgi:hypothetical protein
MQQTYRLRSRYMNGGAPTHCSFCGNPFTDHAWRGSDGKYYCNEYCEEGGQTEPFRETVQ